MSASPLSFFSKGPPPPKVALLRDSVFFSRSIPIAAGATRAEVVTQVGVALEALSPFPLAQLYYGYYWPEAAERALAFASYRRRFTVEQLEEWNGAERVMPVFAALLGTEAGPATTLILTSGEGLTAMHWVTGPVPTVVLHQAVLPEATPEEREAARAGLIKRAGEATKVIDVASTPVSEPSSSNHDLVFSVGALRSVIPAPVAAALDVRDHAELEHLARARSRDMILWRVTLGAIAACFILAIGELALFGGGLWQKTRVTRVASQQGTVEHVMGEQELASRIDDLSTKRLLPLEMVSAVSPETVLPKNPTAIQFLRATANTLDAIQIEAQTSNAGEISGYKSALEQSAGVDKVEIRDQRARDNVVSFTIIVTFKPGFLTPAAS
jgi:hypothetical protein